MKAAKYYFYLCEDSFYKWTKCPKCDTKTKVRKFCLMVNYYDEVRDFLRILSFNKNCKYCTNCELIIAQIEEMDTHLSEVVQGFGVPFNSDATFIFGTMDRKDWANNQKAPKLREEVLQLIAPFKDVWGFKIQPAGWYYEG